MWGLKKKIPGWLKAWVRIVDFQPSEVSFKQRRHCPIILSWPMNRQFCTTQIVNFRFRTSGININQFFIPPCLKCSLRTERSDRATKYATSSRGIIRQNKCLHEVSLHCSRTLDRWNSALLTLLSVYTNGSAYISESAVIYEHLDTKSKMNLEDQFRHPISLIHKCSLGAGTNSVNQRNTLRASNEHFFMH